MTGIIRAPRKPHRAGVGRLSFRDWLSYRSGTALLVGKTLIRPRFTAKLGTLRPAHAGRRGPRPPAGEAEDGRSKLDSLTPGEHQKLRRHPLAEVLIVHQGGSSSRTTQVSLVSGTSISSVSPRTRTSA